MKDDKNIDVIRRQLVHAMLTIPALTLIGCGGSSLASAASPSSPTSLDPTPACDDGDDDQTPAQTEGPYFKSSSPQRSSLLESGVTGTLLTITGRVLTTTCQPISAAKLDFWQADDSGNYDNAGFDCAAISSPTPMADTRCRPSCRDSIQAARVTFTSKRKPRTSQS